MELWSVEVKAGEPLKVQQGEGIIVHLSQAVLGEEVEKGKGGTESSSSSSSSVVLYVNVDGKKLVLGTLSCDNCPQIKYDLVFEQEFELSHNWKNGSVYFIGYRAAYDESDDDDDSDSESEDEEIPFRINDDASYDSGDSSDYGDRMLDSDCSGDISEEEDEAT